MAVGLKVATAVVRVVTVVSAVVRALAVAVARAMVEPVAVLP